MFSLPFRIMAREVIQVALWAALLIGVNGAPLFAEDSDNQFLQLKRQMFSLDTWDPILSQSSWGYSLAKPVSEFWETVSSSTLGYLTLEFSSINPPTSRDHITS
ncbi:uncharacterized protein C3orf85 homolog [Tachyglossus aculeatus]|uniref:uncharacterized protein C3orf85 homolog n=1 Tax=Tachyglossus aculeatus TaxID=9261 RepID=UPI0018F578CC|nr:uncharacterized protein C3orf85 homolog [Tachyglossus aculeatus]XP_038622267.1 uncharacterized protein C3orf85 homolog [Tachyglossus aculeatus]